MQQGTREASRRDTLGSSRRVQVNTIDEQRTLRATVNPSAAATSDKARAAQALSDMFQFGSKIAMDREVDLTEQAAKDARYDFETGKEDLERTQEDQRYRKALAEVTEKAHVADFADQVDTAFSELDYMGMSDEEVHDWINDQFSTEYRDIDQDRDAAEVVLPQLEKLRAGLMSKRREEIREAVKQKQLSDFSVYTEGELAEASARGGEIDYKGLASKAYQLFRGEANEVMFKELSDLAIKKGDSSILKNVPNHWNDNGAVSFTGIPKFNDRIRNAISTADNKAKAMEKAAIKKAEKFAEQQVESGKQALFDMIFNQDVPEDPTQMAQEMISLGAEVSDVMPFMAAYRTQTSFSEKQSSDPAEVTGLLLKLTAGVADLSEVAALAAEGSLGSGDELVSNVTQATESYLRGRNASSEDRALQKTYQDQIDAIYKKKSPFNSALIGGNLAQINTQAHTLFLKATQGRIAKHPELEDDPAAALEYVQKTLPPSGGLTNTPQPIGPDRASLFNSR